MKKHKIVKHESDRLVCFHVKTVKVILDLIVHYLYQVGPAHPVERMG